jgi:hypothetical protein
VTAAAEEAFDDLLEAILDGDPIDWTAAETTAGEAEPRAARSDETVGLRWSSVHRSQRRRRGRVL